MNSTTNSAALKFKGQILNRVYRIWLLRRFLPVFIAEILILSLILYYLGRLVFIQKIIENAVTVSFLNPPQILSFLVSAFANASLAAKFLSAALALIFALIIRHLTQGLLRLFLVRQNYFGQTR